MVLFLKNKEFTCVHTPHDCKNIYPLEFNLPQNENSSFWKLVQGLLPWVTVVVGLKMVHQIIIILPPPPLLLV